MLLSQPQRRAETTKVQESHREPLLYLPLVEQLTMIRQDHCVVVVVSSCSIALADRHLLAEPSLGRRPRASDTSTSTGLLLKHLPELQALIGSSGSQHLTIRAEAAVEDSALVGGNLDVADEGRVAPDAERVVGETA